MASKSVPRFVVIDNSAGLDEVGNEWEALAARHASNLQLFQDYHWNRYWWRYFGDGNEYSLHILTGRENGRLVLVWPLVIKRQGPHQPVAGKQRYHRKRKSSPRTDATRANEIAAQTTH